VMKEFSNTRAIPYHYNYELHVMLIPLCTLFAELVVVVNRVTPHLRISKSCALPKCGAVYSVLQCVWVMSHECACQRS
jgi:hypothetical protein